MFEKKLKKMIMMFINKNDYNNCTSMNFLLLQLELPTYFSIYSIALCGTQIYSNHDDRATQMK